MAPDVELASDFKRSGGDQALGETRFPDSNAAQLIYFFSDIPSFRPGAGGHRGKHTGLPGYEMRVDPDPAAIL